tara:strand:- start:1192 stop:2532 length:1341 start_codon:yes stop_codon:yes gene_type:complete
MPTHKILCDLDVGGEVQGLSLDINGNADISGTLALGDNITFASGKGVRFNDANTRIYTNSETPEDLIIEADQDLLLTPDGEVNITGNLTLSGNATLGGIILDGNTITGVDDSGEFTNDDAHIMTSAAIEDKILGYSYTASALPLAGGTITGTTTFNSDIALRFGSSSTFIEGATSGSKLMLNGQTDIFLRINGSTVGQYDSTGKFTTGNMTVNGDTFTFESANADDPLFLIKNTTNDDQASRLQFQKLRADDAVATGQNLGEIWFSGQDSAQNSEDYAYIVGEIDVSTGGQESGQLIFGVASHDGGNNTGLKLTGGSLDNEVDVTIGNGSASVTAVQGLLTAVGTITGSADVIAYSDKRLKENVKTLDGKKVLEMRGVSFDRVDTGKASSGVIAQEIEKVAPELVIDDGNFKGVAYGNIVGYLIEAIKDQQKQIDKLKEICSGCSK